MSTTDDWDQPLKDSDEFDIHQWENVLKSSNLCAESLPQSINAEDGTSATINQNDMIKLSTRNSNRSAFQSSDTVLQLHQSMTLLIPPSSQQRVRYANECEKIVRYISVPNNQTMTIVIPDLRTSLAATESLWMRITRTTTNDRADGLIFHHPYPLWIKNRHATVHHGSIFVPLHRNDMNNGLVQIDTLTMIRLKQDDLVKIGALTIYSVNRLDARDRYSIKTKSPKQIRDEYKLRQSILSFQLVQVDANNIAHLTDCICHTEPLHEMEANAQRLVARKGNQA